MTDIKLLRLKTLAKQLTKKSVKEKPPPKYARHARQFEHDFDRKDYLMVVDDDAVRDELKSTEKLVSEIYQTTEKDLEQECLALDSELRPVFCDKKRQPAIEGDKVTKTQTEKMLRHKFRGTYVTGQIEEIEQEQPLI